MAQVIIDKGYFKLGMHNMATGETTEPRWISDSVNGRGIVVGLEGKPFALFCIDDTKDIFKEVVRLLNLPSDEEEGVENEQLDTMASDT